MSREYYKDRSFRCLTGTPRYHKGDLIKNKLTRKIYEVEDQLSSLSEEVIVKNSKAGKLTIFGTMITEDKFIWWWLVRLLIKKEYKKYSKNQNGVV